MKKILLLVTFGILGLTAQAETYYGPTHITNANLEQIVIHGTAKLEHIKTDSLTVTGPLQFKNLDVTQDTQISGPVKNSENGKFGSLKIAGPFEAKQIACDTLEVIGPVKVKRLAVIGKTDIIGPLEAENSHLQNLTITANEITLDNVEVDNILIKNDRSQKQTLHLKGKTHVTGNITFESRRGIVTRGEEVAIKGEVKGVVEENG